MAPVQALIGVNAQHDAKHVYVYMYTYIYIYVYVFTYTPTYMWIYIYIFKHVCIYLCTHTNIQAFIGLNVQHDANHGAVSQNPFWNDLLGFGIHLCI